MNHFNLAFPAQPQFDGFQYCLQAEKLVKRRRWHNCLVMMWLVFGIALPVDFAVYWDRWAGFGVGAVMLVVSTIVLSGKSNVILRKLHMPTFALFPDDKTYINDCYADQVGLLMRVSQGTAVTFFIERGSEDNGALKGNSQDGKRYACVLLHMADIDTLAEIAVICNNAITHTDTVKFVESNFERQAKTYNDA